MTPRTLFLAHRMPFPPDRGDKIRSHHLLRAIAALGPVHVGTFAESAADWAAESTLADIAESHCLVRRPASLMRAGLQALAKGKPVSLTAFASDRLREWVARTIAAHAIDTIFVFSGQMGQYVPSDFGGRVVIDLCDVDSAKFEAYARDRGGLRGWIDAREGRLLAAEEARLVELADWTLLVSEAEADLLRSRVGRADLRIAALGNGIDTALFDPQAVDPHPLLAREAGPHIVFTGQMDYPPNVAAAIRTTRHLMPAIHRRHPGARFHVVGRAPVSEVRVLDGVDGTHVWGEVPDVRPFLAASDLVIAPLTIARGVQNKVLEAMAMAGPVLLTPEAATGIDGTAERHFVIARSNHELAERACDLLADPERARAMGVAARQYVQAYASWANALAPLRSILAEPPSETLDAA